MRIAIGGFQHETNTFAPSKATWDDFVAGGGAILDQVAGEVVGASVERLPGGDLIAMDQGRMALGHDLGHRVEEITIVPARECHSLLSDMSGFGPGGWGDV